ncbi:hypothetical protein PTKIN_Ptkin09bG0150300 [Pterospermum kingtungense]
MKTFMMTFDTRAWFVVERGIGVPSNDRQFMKKIQDDAKAKCFLYEALDSHNFNLVLNCTTSKEIWEKLEEMHGEGRKEEMPCEIQYSTSEKANKEGKSIGKHSPIENDTCLMALDKHRYARARKDKALIFKIESSRHIMEDG